MKEKLLQLWQNRKPWVIGGAIVLAVVLFLIIRGAVNANTSAAGEFQTTKAARGTLTALVGATGSVHANQSTVLAWQTTGRVLEVNVVEGSKVKKGDILARLDPTSLPQNIILAQADLVEARRALENAKSSDLARAQAELNLAQAQEALESADNKREGQKYDRADEDVVDEYRSELTLAEDAYEKTKELYDQFADRPESDATRARLKLELRDARLRLERAQANLNYITGKPDANEIALADAELAVAQARLADAQREWERLKDGPDPEDIAAAEARVAAVEATVNLGYLIAPFDGTITKVDFQVGDQVSPNSSSIRIDDLSKMLVDVDIPEVDINRVKMGQKVTMTFDAILDKTFNGEVVEIARAGQVIQGNVSFTVTIRLLDADPSVLPGMTAAVNITVEEVQDALLVPTRTVRLRDGKRVVFLLRDGQAAPVEVRLGSASDTQVQILGGDVKEGDLVILNPPAETFTGGPFGGN